MTFTLHLAQTTQLRLALTDDHLSSPSRKFTVALLSNCAYHMVGHFRGYKFSPVQVFAKLAKIRFSEIFMVLIFAVGESALASTQLKAE